MVPTFFYSDVTAIIAEAHKGRLQVLRSTLYFLGFRNTKWVETAQDLEALCNRVKPDLIIAAADLPDGETGGFIQRLRRGHTQADPFTPVIGILGEASPAAVRRGVDSGADDLLIHPWPQGYLDQRLQKLVTGRKPFVVTADYVGPDRRSVPRPGPQARMVTPPNVLTVKALERRSLDAVAGDLAQARAGLDGHRIQSLADLVVGLTGELVASYARGIVGGAENATRLERLLAAASEAVILAPRTGHAKTAGQVLADVVRHGRLCRDAQDLGRVASITELEALAQTLAGRFKLDGHLTRREPAGGDVRAFRRTPAPHAASAPAPHRPANRAAG